METIKFRAKDEDTNEWLYGYYTEFATNEGRQVNVIVTEESKYRKALGVIPYTLGQFSSFYDKDNNEIYHGDILELSLENDKVIKVICWFGNAQRTLYYGEFVEIRGFSFIVPGGKRSFPVIENYQGKHDVEIMKIIGNIWDNSDLIDKDEYKL